MPRRKPASERMNRETRDLGMARRNLGRLPECPKINGKPLAVNVQKAWVTFWESDISGLVLDADLPALNRLFEYYHLRQRFLRTFLSKPFVGGSMGQVTAHPAAKEVASLDSRIQPLEDRFGITPSGRLKLGITLGAAAKSLADMNAEFDADDDEQEEADPRLATVHELETG